MVKNKLFAGIGALSIIGSNPSFTSEPKPTVEAVIQQRLEKIDPLMNRALAILRIPGMAIGVVVDGKVLFTKGYGVRNFSDPSPVTENTLFAIGSCSKAFTTFALGQLIDEGLIAWDDPVIKYLPEFRLHDIHATHHLTIRDLVTHRSGLPRHDLAWYNSIFPRGEILNRLPFLEPTCDLREKFQYNNCMYAVAGLVIERVSGKTWEEFVQERIFKPLCMNHSNFSVEVSQQADDFSFPHTEKNENIEVIPFRKLTNIGPAGSINATIADMMKWVELQLSDGKQLIQKETLKDMHLVHMPVHNPIFEDEFGYGLGWFTALHEGHYIVSHGGGIDGFISMVTLYPKEKIGVVVLTNSDSHGLFPMMAAYGIADLLLGKEDETWLSKVEEKEAQMKETMKKARELKKDLAQVDFLHASDQYVGKFEHPGYGTLQIDLKNDGLVAIHNDILYQVSPTGYDYFHLAMESRAEDKLEGSFVANRSGDISQLQISFEPQLAPIVFKRKVSNELIAADYLRSFIGAYECPLFSMEIALKGGHLTATVPGQPSCGMKPEKKNLFSLKELPGCTIEFVIGATNQASELRLSQGGQTFSLKAKEVLND
jgi:CubicO group peptidase (beta-lactamase class C family)